MSEDLKYFLLIAVCDYADEFDTEKFWVRKGSNEDAIKHSVKQALQSQPEDWYEEEDGIWGDPENPTYLASLDRYETDDLYFGTNEHVSADDFLNNLRITEITEEEYKTLLKLFGKHLECCGWGTGPDIEWIE